MNLYTIEARSKRMVRSDLLLIRLLSDALRRNIREISPETPSEHLGIVKNEILFKMVHFKWTYSYVTKYQFLR